ncbi:hypothetical protein STANM309S_05500 [Streptomyces tanashiensis]
MLMTTWRKSAYCVYSIDSLDCLVTTATATMTSAGTHITAKSSIGRTLDLALRPRP